MGRIILIGSLAAALLLPTAQAEQPPYAQWWRTVPTQTPPLGSPTLDLSDSREDPTWKDELFLRRFSIGLNVIDTPSFEMGVQGGQRAGHDRYTETTPLGVDEVDDSLELGVFTQGRYGDYLIGTRVSKDVSGNHEGVLGEFMAGYEAKLSKKLGLTLGVGATWADERFMAAYYGVDTGQASRGGLSPYSPGAGFSNASLQLTACYQLTDLWSLGAKVGYLRLVGDAADSPISGLEQEKERFITGLQFQYALPGLNTQRSFSQYQPNCAP